MSTPPRRPRPAPRPVGDPVPHRAGVLDVVGLVLCGVSAALAALIEVLLTPLYIGAVLVPVCILLAVATNSVLPILARGLVESTFAAAMPVLVWALALLLLSSSRPEGDVLLPGGKGAQPLVSYGLLIVGTLAGVLTVVSLSHRPAPR